MLNAILKVCLCCCAVPVLWIPQSKYGNNAKDARSNIHSLDYCRHAEAKLIVFIQQVKTYPDVRNPNSPSSH